MVVKRENTGFRQNQIAVAAADLIVKYGSEHVTIKRLAVHTGLSEAAIYRHFKSKSDIFHFLLKHVESALMADFNIFDLQDTVSIFNTEKLDILIDKHISRIEKNRGTELHVIAEIVSMGDASLNQSTYQVINNYIYNLAQVFRKARMRNCDNRATIFFTLVQGLVYLWALSGYAFNFKHRFYQLWSK